jgi:hypothetical protein
VADEHQADWCGQKGYVAITAAAVACWAWSITPAADEEHLVSAYGQFVAEARQLKPDYAPQTGNTDGWMATQNALQALFGKIVVMRKVKC